MAPKTLTRSLPAITITAAGALGSGALLNSAHAASDEAPRIRTFKGPTEDTRHGPIQVSIGVASKKIVKVSASIAPPDDGRSPFLQQRAMPILKQETLKAQSADIDTMSGATESSEAYIQSLGAAISTARKAHALR
jgi:uncharacterized protein with FMN-binding domain